MQTAMARAVAQFVATHGGPDAASLTPVKDVVVIRSTSARNPFRKLYRPSLCVVAQGAKRIALDDAIIDYEAGSALAVSVTVPGQGSITRASKEEPFLGLTITFNVALLREVLEQMPAPPRASGDRLGAFVGGGGQKIDFSSIFGEFAFFVVPKASQSTALPVVNCAVTTTLRRARFAQ